MFGTGLKTQNFGDKDVEIWLDGTIEVVKNSTGGLQIIVPIKVSDIHPMIGVKVTDIRTNMTFDLEFSEGSNGQTMGLNVNDHSKVITNKPHVKIAKIIPIPKLGVINKKISKQVQKGVDKAAEELQSKLGDLLNTENISKQINSHLPSNFNLYGLDINLNFILHGLNIKPSTDGTNQVFDIDMNAEFETKISFPHLKDEFKGFSWYGYVLICLRNAMI